jgi:glutaminyl-peptide cyclotransferase
LLIEKEPTKREREWAHECEMRRTKEAFFFCVLFIACVSALVVVKDIFVTSLRFENSARERQERLRRTSSSSLSSSASIDDEDDEDDERVKENVARERRGRDEDEAHAQAEENFREKRANGRDHRAEDDGAIMKSNKDDGVKFYTYAIKNVYEHDRNAFTQGLVYDSQAKVFYESVGSVPRGTTSDARRVEVLTGEVLEKSAIPIESFGEGITKISSDDSSGNFLLQLTWRSNRVYVHDVEQSSSASNFEGKFTKLKKNVKFFETDLNDGWGITTSTTGNNNLVVISNGTEFLSIFNFSSRKTIRTIRINDNGVAQRFPNELERVKDEIWANILERECIARIDENTGNVLGWIDFTGLKNLGGNRGVGGVMNGIAYDEVGERVFVTGKNWASLFEVEIVEKNDREFVELSRKRCHSPKTLPQYGYP